MPKHSILFLSKVTGPICGAVAKVSDSDLGDWSSNSHSALGQSLLLSLTYCPSHGCCGDWMRGQRTMYFTLSFLEERWDRNTINKYPPCQFPMLLQKCLSARAMWAGQMAQFLPTRGLLSLQEQRSQLENNPIEKGSCGAFTKIVKTFYCAWVFQNTSS